MSSRAADLEVVPLDRNGIADILARQPADVAEPPDGLDLAGELDRLSGGDPLLVSLYLDELHRWRQADRRPTVTNVAALEPGFAPLFRRWLDEQERLSLDTGIAIARDRLDLLLALLACALGPLRHADLAALCRELRGPDYSLPKSALTPLARFLYGDGDRHGYVLCHPKFGHFLRCDYFGDPAIVEAADEAFRSWSHLIVGRLDAGTLPPEKCPTYLLLYFRQHLEVAGAPLADFLALTGNGWRLARERLEGGPSGFGGDVARVLERARSELLNNRVPRPSAALAVVLRCSLILASLNSLGANTPVVLLLAAAKKGVLSKDQVMYLGRVAGVAKFSAVVAGLAGSLT